MNWDRPILTDSGGIQEEAVSLNKRVLVLRDKTERIEGIDSGNLIIDKNNIADYVSKLLTEENIDISNNANVYGDGTASEKIVDILKKI